MNTNRVIETKTQLDAAYIVACNSAFEVSSEMEQEPKMDLNCFHYVTDSIMLVREHLLVMPRGSWVFWDLDDTVFIPTSPELRKVNQSRLTKHLESLELEYPNIRELIWDLYDVCDYKLVENEILGLMEELKAKEIYVLGLTKRRVGHATVCQREKELSHEDLTLGQLDKLGVKLSEIFPEGEIILHEIGPRDSNTPLEIWGFEFQGAAIFKNKVAFTSGMAKGIIAKILIEKAQELGIPLPPEVALIDDIEYNLETVEIALKNKEVQFLGIHYRGAMQLFDNEHIDFSNITYQINFLNEKKRVLSDAF